MWQIRTWPNKVKASSCASQPIMRSCHARHSSKRRECWLRASTYVQICSDNKTDDRVHVLHTQTPTKRISFSLRSLNRPWSHWNASRSSDQHKQSWSSRSLLTNSNLNFKRSGRSQNRLLVCFLLYTSDQIFVACANISRTLGRGKINGNIIMFDWKLETLDRTKYIEFQFQTMATRTTCRFFRAGQETGKN